MKRLLIIVSVLLAAAFAILALVVRRAPEQDTVPFTAGSAPITHSTDGPADEDHRGFLYGRIATDKGESYEGRLRFGIHEEAFWDDWFNGYKAANPWRAYVPTEQLTERRSIGIFGFEIAHRDVEIELGRPFMVRFGDISRIDVDGRELQVTLENGTVFDLDRFNADDIADGVRVWDATHGVVDLVEWRIRSVEFFPTPRLGDVPGRLHGTVRTQRGTFTGFVQWNRESCVGSDEIVGESGGAMVRLRFDTLRSIERTSPDSSLVTLRDGSEIELSGAAAVGDGNRGVHVEDRRYGRVLVSWQAFRRLDFGTGGRGTEGSGPAYDDFPPSGPLTGAVTTRDGRRLAGRLVYDLDESETAETLDAPSRGVNYTIPFGLVASIGPADDEEHSTVSLHSGDKLQLERTGDLGESNAGLLVFADGREQAEYVPWGDVRRVDFDPPQAMNLPLGGL